MAHIATSFRWLQASLLVGSQFETCGGFIHTAKKCERAQKDTHHASIRLLVALASPPPGTGAHWLRIPCRVL